MNNDWLDNEMRELNEDLRTKIKSRDNVILIKVLIFLIPLLIYSMTLSGYEEHKYHKVRCEKKDGVFWTCKACRTSQWQASNKADWWGNYYCGKCGVKK